MFQNRAQTKSCSIRYYKSTTLSVTLGKLQTVTDIAGENAIGTHIPPFLVIPCQECQGFNYLVEYLEQMVESEI